MAFVGLEDYRRACDRAGELVDRVTLLEAIELVYELWFKDKYEERVVNFHSYFGLSLLDIGIDDLFKAKQYRVALAAYFQPRALRKLARMREMGHVTIPYPPKNHVEHASTMRVRIWVNKDVSLEFKTHRRKGKLRWSHVYESFTVIRSGDGFVSDVDRHRARKQALMVLNNVRDRAERNRRTG